MTNRMLEAVGQKVDNVVKRAETRNDRAAISTLIVLHIIAESLLSACANYIQSDVQQQLIIPTLGAENNGLTPDKNAELNRLRKSFLDANNAGNIQYRSDEALQDPGNPALVEKKNFNEILELSLKVKPEEVNNLDLNNENQTVFFSVEGVSYAIVGFDDASGKKIQMFFGTNDGGKSWSQAIVGKGRFTLMNDGSKVLDAARSNSFTSETDFAQNFGGLSVLNTTADGKTSSTYLLFSPLEENSDGQIVPPENPTVVSIDQNGEVTYLEGEQPSQIIDGIHDISFKPPPPDTTIDQPPATAETTTNAPELNVSPEVKTVLDAQKAPYTVNTEGKAVIDLKDTPATEQIVLEQVGHTPTNDGLAKDILTGLDKDGIRYIFGENYGWVKDIEPGTPEKRTKVDYEDFGNGVINTIAALHYQENPTIPESAIDSDWWIQGGGSKELGGYMGTLTITPFDNNKVKEFTRSTKSFGEPTLWLEYTKNLTTFVAVVQPNNNPSLENEEQTIQLPLTFDADRFDQVGDTIENLKDYLLNDKVIFQILITPPPPRSDLLSRLTNMTGPDNVFSTSKLQSPGNLFKLFRTDEQEALLSVWDKMATVPWGNIPDGEVDVAINVLPEKLALEPLPANFDQFPWGDIQP